LSNRSAAGDEGRIPRDSAEDAGDGVVHRNFDLDGALALKVHLDANGTGLAPDKPFISSLHAGGVGAEEGGNPNAIVDIADGDLGGGTFVEGFAYADGPGGILIGLADDGFDGDGGSGGSADSDKVVAVFGRWTESAVAF
jgi:hypothetical protein